MNNSIKIEFIADKEKADILIAILSDIGYYAFEEGETLAAYIKEEDFDEAALKEETAKQKITFTVSVIEPANWNKKWESEFNPIIIDNFVAIRAHFHEPIKQVQHEIIITPKMSFGTGHHATTHLMLQEMELIDFKDKRVLDFGTGTGVLAILAAKMGGIVTAVDNDEWSITNAKENFENNNIEIELILLDRPANGTYDIVLANINRNIILSNIEAIKMSACKDALIVVSGILIEDLEVIKEGFLKHGYTFLKHSERNGWICCSFLSI